MLKHVIRICYVTSNQFFFIYIYYIYHDINHINENKYVIGLHSVPSSYWSERLLKDSSHLDFVTKNSTFSQYMVCNVR